MSKFIEQLRALWPRALKPGRPHTFVCRGGPLAGERLALRTGGTLEFSLKGHTGRYVLLDVDPDILIWKEKETV